jgi:pimeloyl-ACP methyl ester carboxylesterase
VITALAGIALVSGLAACTDSPTPAPAPTDGAPTAAIEPSTQSKTAVGDEHTVTLDGHRVAFYVTAGTGATIVLDAGGGNGADYWNDLVPRLAAETGAQIITYDRIGQGLSDLIAGGFSPASAAADLAAGLEQLALPNQPVLLASHSLAGEVSTAIVNAYPGLIDGAVLIDANVPQFFTPEETARLAAATEEEVAEAKAAPATDATRQLINLAIDWEPAHLVYNKMVYPTDVPVNVIVAETTPFAASPEDAQRWRDAQVAFVAESPSNRTLTTAVESSHDVPLDRPDLVVEQVKDMLAKI